MTRRTLASHHDASTGLEAEGVRPQSIGELIAKKAGVGRPKRKDLRAYGPSAVAVIGVNRIGLRLLKNQSQNRSRAGRSKSCDGHSLGPLRQNNLRRGLRPRHRTMGRTPTLETLVESLHLSVIDSSYSGAISAFPIRSHLIRKYVSLASLRTIHLFCFPVLDLVGL